MSFFSDNYCNIRYPIDETGLRTSQVGAIHAIASHFTVHATNALVTMPTGTGKTAVLMMTPFVLQAKRVLVITPSRLVRYQIAEDFRELKTLKAINVLDQLEGDLRCFELNTKVLSLEDWAALEEYDVVISTPNCTSPLVDDIPTPPEELFDLVLIDEAHHSTAKTWAGIMTAFPKAKKVLFTATPFRRDKKIINAAIIYSYPLSLAYEDGTFGKIKFEPVNTINATDLHIAQKAEEILAIDKQRGLQHALMVRTDSKTKAKELLKLYTEHTSLTLQQIDSGHTYLHIKKTLKKLEEGEIDGIICVDMLGEGYNFPKLKIAALHAPHKSLEVTLQFIGRFSRTAKGVDEAKFIAIPNEIELEAEKIYQEGKTWQEIITNLSENRIKEEVENRQMIEAFHNVFVNDETLQDLSLFALKPYYHVKIYRALDVDIYVDVKLPNSAFKILRKDVNDDNSTVIIISGSKTKPRWAINEIFDAVDYDLFIIFFHKASNLLFINSTVKNYPIYYSLASQYTNSKPKALPDFLINKVLLNVLNAKFFNVGMKNLVSGNRSESYRIYSGSGAHKSIKKSDGQMYGRGHLFAKGDVDGKPMTIGLSTASKVWSNKSTTIPIFIKWCEELALRIESDENPQTNTELDFLKLPHAITHVPQITPICVNWHPDVYKNAFTIKNEETQQEYFLLDAEIVIDYDKTTIDRIVFSLEFADLVYPISFQIDDSVDFFTALADISLLIGTEQYHIPFIEYVNENPFAIYFNDFSFLELHNFYSPPDKGAINFDIANIEEIQWADSNVDVTAEFENAQHGEVTIHEYMNNHYIPLYDFDFVFYDHGKGEIADFICVKVFDEIINVQLFHIKASKGTDAGIRVGDTYEVTSQAIRSARWLNNLDLMVSQFSHRQTLNNKYGFRRDRADLLAEILNANPRKIITFQNVLVQPGISKAECSSDDNITNNLAACFDFCQLQNCQMRVLASS